MHHIMNITIVFWLAIKFIVLAKSEEVISFTCPYTAQNDLQDISSLFNCIPKYIPENNTVECRGERQWFYEMHFKLAFKIMDKISEDNMNATDHIRHCVSLQSYEGRCYSYDEFMRSPTTFAFSFNDSQVVGVVEADRLAWNANRTANISMLSDLLKLTIFQSTLCWNANGNFSSSHFWTQSSWLLGINFADHHQCMKPNFLTSLQNTGIRKLNISYAFNEDVILLRDMPQLQEIIFYRTFMKALHNDTCIGTPEVTSLIINGGYLHGIPKLIERIPKLKILEISRPFTREYFEIPVRELGLTTFLEELNLEYNDIYSISEKLPFLPHLKKLYLKNCHITILQEKDFQNVSNLQEIDLSGNYLTYVNENVFVSLRKLKILDFSRNNISNWPVLLGNSLHSLDLSQNFLTSLMNLGNSEVSVIFLNISKNSIQNWDDKYMFSAIGSRIKGHHGLWLNCLDISHNMIVGLSEVMIESVNGLEELDLGGNPFDCIDCRMIPFQKYLNTTLTNVTNLGTSNPLECTSPIQNLGQALVLVQHDETLCLQEEQKLWIIVGVPLGMILILILVIATIIYHFRSQIAYMMHLFKIRKRAHNFSKSSCNNHAFDAFVSYSAHDRRFVLTELAPLLEKGPEQYVVCLHERDFLLGSHIVENIVGSIQHSRKAILVLSQHFIDSKWCKWEMEMANHKTFHDDEHFLILIQLGKLKRHRLPRHLKLLMDTRTYLEWPPPGHKDEDKIRQRLKHALGQSIYEKTNKPAPTLSDLVDF